MNCCTSVRFTSPGDSGSVHNAYADAPMAVHWTLLEKGDSLKSSHPSHFNWNPFSFCLCMSLWGIVSNANQFGISNWHWRWRIIALSAQVICSIWLLWNWLIDSQAMSRVEELTDAVERKIDCKMKYIFPIQVNPTVTPTPHQPFVFLSH
jgi:hypothetical protein